MKYILYIILIAFTATMSLLYEPSAPQQAGQHAIRVNGRTVSKQELDDKVRTQPALLGGATNITNSLITREILIDEALRQHIDQEESFQKQLKNFYEQSLVSVLVDRKLDSIAYSPTLEEIEAYKKLQGQQISLELQPAADQLQVDVPSEVGLEKLTGLFDELSLPIRMNILFLKAGQTSEPVRIFGSMYVIHVQDIGPAKATAGSVDEASIRANITEYRREEIFSTWLQSLREQATVELASDNTGVNDHE